MKNRIFLFFMICVLCIPLSAQQTQQAKDILDRTSAALSGDSGIKATFLLKNYRMKRLYDQTEGTILLKGNRFQLETPGTTTWFNGRTQWTYMVQNEEINISNPTEEELQSINPYYFINLYEKGFTYRTDGTTIHNGKKVYRLILVPENTRQEISEIELLIEQNSYRPALIRVSSRNGDEMTVDVRSYQSNLNLKEGDFTLDPKRYPDAEIIDLR